MVKEKDRYKLEALKLRHQKYQTEYRTITWAAFFLAFITIQMVYKDQIDGYDAVIFALCAFAIIIRINWSKRSDLLDTMEGIEHQIMGIGELED